MTALPQSAIDEIESLLDATDDLKTDGPTMRRIDQLGLRYGGHALAEYLTVRLEQIQAEVQQQTLNKETLERGLEFLERMKDSPQPVMELAGGFGDGFRLDMARPLWEGTVGFGRAWDETIELLRDPQGHIQSELVVLTADTMQAQIVAVELANARVVRFDPEQVMVLPHWEGPEHMFDYAADVALPFPHLFLDFELYDRWAVFPMPEIVKGMAIRLLSACVYRNPEDNALVVMPRISFEENGKHTGGAARFVATVWFQPWDGVSAKRWDQQVVSPVYDGQRLAATFAGIRPTGREDAVVMLPGSRSMFEREADLIDIPDIAGKDMETIAAGVSMFAVDRTLAALSILDSEIVDLDDAPVPRQSRRRMEREGGKIAKIVSIRSPRRGPTNKPSGNEIEFSHRFWVRGHTKHFPVGTHMADVRPDLVGPCTRRVGACERGCRRIWTPPFIKGPADKPLVLKTLVRSNKVETS